MLYNILPQCYIVLELFSRFNNVWLVNSNHPNYVGHEMSHLISSPQVISIIWLFSFLSASPWALFTKVLQKYCVFSRVFPWYLEQNKLLLCTILSFFYSFHQGASTISTGKFISFLTCTFFTIANDICQTQQCPFTFYFLSVQTLLWHLLTKRRQSFERNIRQERVSNEMHDVIQNF